MSHNSPIKDPFHHDILINTACSPWLRLPDLALDKLISLAAQLIIFSAVERLQSFIVCLTVSAQQFFILVLKNFCVLRDCFAVISSTFLRDEIASSTSQKTKGEAMQKLPCTDSHTVHVKANEAKLPSLTLTQGTLPTAKEQAPAARSNQIQSQ